MSKASKMQKKFNKLARETPNIDRIILTSFQELPNDKYIWKYEIHGTGENEEHCQQISDYVEAQLSNIALMCGLGISRDLGKRHWRYFKTPSFRTGFLQY